MLALAPQVVTFADIPGIRDKLPQMAQQLDVCQRALADFLEEKRSQFPRFYFLGACCGTRSSAAPARRHCPCPSAPTAHFVQCLRPLLCPHAVLLPSSSPSCFQ